MASRPCLCQSAGALGVGSERILPRKRVSARMVPQHVAARHPADPAGQAQAASAPVRPGALRGSFRAKSRKEPERTLHCEADLGRCPNFGRLRFLRCGTSTTNERKYVLRNQNTYRRTLKAVTLTATLACVLASGAGITSSHAHSAAYNMRNYGVDVGSGLSGIASVYHDPITANGEHMNPNAMTAAHKSLPMGSMVTVHNRNNGRWATVRINDRGPYVRGRVIDLSPGAARVLGVDGLAPVSLTVGGRTARRV